MLKSHICTMSRFCIIHVIFDRNRNLHPNGENRGFDPRQGQTKDIKLVFAASPLNTQHL